MGTVQRKQNEENVKEKLRARKRESGQEPRTISLEKFTHLFFRTFFQQRARKNTPLHNLKISTNLGGCTVPLLTSQCMALRFIFLTVLKTCLHSSWRKSDQLFAWNSGNCGDTATSWYNQRTNRLLDKYTKKTKRQ